MPDASSRQMSLTRRAASCSSTEDTCTVKAPRRDSAAPASSTKDTCTVKAPRRDSAAPASSIIKHWSLFSADRKQLDRHSTTGPIMALWLAAILLGFTLIGGLPAMGLHGVVPDSLRPNVLQMVWIFFSLATLRWVPEDHNSAAIFWMHALVGGLATDGIFRGDWRCLTNTWIIFMFPMLDCFVGTDSRNPPPKDQLESKAFRAASLAQPVCQLIFLVWSCAIIAHGNDSGKLSLAEVIGAAFSFGTYAGAQGITCAHELCHSHNKLDKWLGLLNLVLVGYPHFEIEHGKGHHKMVATAEDPATARAGEHIYAFLPRVLVGELQGAMELERLRLKKSNKPFLHPDNELLRLFGCSIGVACAIGGCFGGMAALFFCAQAIVAVILFETVNYLEHYGLERRLLSEDESLPIEWHYESVGLSHAWDSPTRLLNTFVLKLQRHADHHVHAGKRYQQLETSDASPQLPGGYITMILIAFLPPLWYAVMDPRLLEHRRNAPRQRYRYWPRGMAPPEHSTFAETRSTRAAAKGAAETEVVETEAAAAGRAAAKVAAETEVVARAAAVTAPPASPSPPSSGAATASRAVARRARPTLAARAA